MHASRLDHAQLRSFSKCLHRLYGAPTGENPVKVVLDSLEDLVPCDSLIAGELRFSTLCIKYVDCRNLEAIPNLEEAFHHIAEDHPGFLYRTKHGFADPCLKLSDFVTQRQLRELHVYEHFSKVHPCRDQADVHMHIAGGLLGIGLARGRVFSSEEMLMLELLQPHMERILNRCARYADLDCRAGLLTPREREVLHWVAQGKQDDEIARILGNSVRTVNQHVHNLLDKLGVENRTAAVAMVLGGTQHAPHN